MLVTDSVLPLSQDHIAAIGRVTAYFSLLEKHANALIADLLELNSQDDVISITAHMNASTKIQLIRTLASTRFKDDEDLTVILKEAIADLDSANRQRNDIVHAHWYYYSPSTNVSGRIKQTARGVIKTELERYTPDQINAVATHIFVATGKIQSFLMKKNGELRIG